MNDGSGVDLVSLLVAFLLGGSIIKDALNIFYKIQIKTFY